MLRQADRHCAIALRMFEGNGEKVENKTSMLPTCKKRSLYEEFGFFSRKPELLHSFLLRYRLIERRRSFSIAPAIFGTLCNLYRIYAPPPPLSPTDHFRTASIFSSQRSFRRNALDDPYGLPMPRPCHEPHALAAVLHATVDARATPRATGHLLAGDSPFARTSMG